MERDSEEGTGPLTDRRRFLAALAAASTPAAAGCSEQLGGDPTTSDTTAASSTTATTEATETTAAETTSQSGPSPRIASVSVSPDPVPQVQPATATIAVANDGTERVEGVLNVEFTDEFVAAPSVDVPAGGTVERTVEFERARVGANELAVAVRADGDTLAEATREIEVASFPEHHVTADGTDLVCGDGAVNFAGASPASAMYPGAIGEGIEGTFDALAERGVTSLRVWGYAPSWAEMESMPEPYTYNDAWFEYFDRVVLEAKRRDIRLFVALANGNPAYGPVNKENLSVNVPQFVRWSDNARSRNEFFYDPECQAMYKDWVERLVTNENHLTGVEYRDDPTIAMWELGNEVQKSPPKVGESIRPWMEEMGNFVKSLDDQTLLTTGSYGHQGRNAFVDEASADPIDVVSIHYYPGPEHYDMPEDEVIPTLEATIDTVREDIGKPLFVGEYNWGVAEEDSAPYEERAAWLERLNGVLQDRGVAATNLWTVAAAERPSYHKPATIYAPEEELGLQQLDAHCAAMREQSDSSCIESGND